MSDAWQVHDGGQQYGPFTKGDIAAMMAEGRISASAQIWQEGMAAWAPIGQVIPPQIMQPAIYPPTSAVPLPARRRKPTGVLARYKYRVGNRSFIFQCIIAGWTTMIIAWVLAVTVSAAGAEHSHPRGTEERKAEEVGTALGMLSGWLCMFGAWGLIVIPCGIAAIATAEGNKM